MCVNIFKCMLLIFVFCGFTFAKTPCVNINNKLNATQKEVLQNNLKRQLKAERVNVLKLFKVQNSSVGYIETYDADEAFVFYVGDEYKSNFIIMWSGAAEISEEKNIEKWAKDNVPGIPARLAQCFAWYAIYRHD